MEDEVRNSEAVVAGEDLHALFCTVPNGELRERSSAYRVRPSPPMCVMRGTVGCGKCAYCRWQVLNTGNISPRALPPGDDHTRVPTVPLVLSKCRTRLPPEVTPTGAPRNPCRFAAFSPFSSVARSAARIGDLRETHQATGSAPPARGLAPGRGWQCCPALAIDHRHCSG